MQFWPKTTESARVQCLTEVPRRDESCLTSKNARSEGVKAYRGEPPTSPRAWQHPGGVKREVDWKNEESTCCFPCSIFHLDGQRKRKAAIVKNMSCFRFQIHRRAMLGAGPATHEAERQQAFIFSTSPWSPCSSCFAPRGCQSQQHLAAHLPQGRLRGWTCFDQTCPSDHPPQPCL